MLSQSRTILVCQNLQSSCGNCIDRCPIAHDSQQDCSTQPHILLRGWRVTLSRLLLIATWLEAECVVDETRVIDKADNYSEGFTKS